MIIKNQTWNLSKILHRQIFRLKILHRQFHLISRVLVRKNTKNEWKWRNLHRCQKFYTAAGTDGMDKFHLWFLVPFCLQVCRLFHLLWRCAPSNIYQHFWKCCSLQKLCTKLSVGSICTSSEWIYMPGSSQNYHIISPVAISCFYSHLIILTGPSPRPDRLRWPPIPRGGSHVMW